jgi:hypothetical protein
MTVRLPPNGEVLKTAHVAGLAFIPGAKKKPRLGIYAVSGGHPPERECAARRETVGTIVRLSWGWSTIAFGEPVESMYP